MDEGALGLIAAWVEELTRDYLRGPNDPLFPATEMGLGAEGGFVPVGLSRRGWATSGPVRDVFRRAFTLAGLPYLNPHSFRSMLVRHAMMILPRVSGSSSFCVDQGP